MKNLRSAAAEGIRASWETLPIRVRFGLVALGLTLAALALYRIVFFCLFIGGAPDAGTRVWIGAFYLGTKFDLRYTLILLLPFWLLSWIPWINPIRSPAARWVWFTYFLAAWGLTSLVYFIDFGFYAYLHSRVDAGAIELVQEPSIAAQMVWDSYPVIPGFLAWGAVVAAYGWLFRRFALPRLSGAPARARLGGRILIGLCTAFLILAGLYGKLSWYPLRWSDAYSFTNPLACAVGLNPVLYIADTWEGRRQDYDRKAVEAHYNEVAAQLGVTDPDPKRLNFRRDVKPKGMNGHRPNVVIIFLESFAAFKTGTFGNRLRPTPNFDAIAKDSLLFRNFFVPRGSTARSIFGVVTGVPDVNPVHSASRNPRLVRQHSLVNAFRGYDKMYFIGGSASWGNIRGFLTQSIPGIRIYEEGDYDSPRNDGWGISDLDLFREADRILSSRKQPFVAFIQTAGNHRPYTIPADHGDFKLVHVDDGLLRENGFSDGLAEFNSLRFLDYSLGRFIRLARSSPYFHNTYFFILGDHGTVANGHDPFEQIGLSQHHVPLAIYAPGLIPKGREILTETSSLDVLPMAAGLAGIPYSNGTMGRDVLSHPPDAPRYFYVGNLPVRGLIGQGYYYQIRPDGSERLYRYRSADPARDVSKDHPDLCARLRRLCIGMYETARFLLFHSREQVR